MTTNLYEVQQSFDEIVDMLNRVVCFTDSERKAKERVIETTRKLKWEYIDKCFTNANAEKMSSIKYEK